MKNDFDIARLIAGSLTGELSTEELERLGRWRSESDQNERLFLKITDENNRKLKRELYQSFDKDGGWGEVRQKRKATLRGKRYLRLARYAAAILLPLILGVVIYTQLGGGKDDIIAVTPGTQSARLILPSGEEVDLTGVTGAITVDGSQTAYNDAGQISYAVSSETQVPQAGQPVYHRMVVPRGGDYRLELGDGTVIYLNSMTSIRFPVDFSGDTREVTLDGEAYFEVASDPEKPFIVHTSGYDIQVLGTQFNVSSYAGDSRTQTTLIEGSVMITGLGDGIVLESNQQFSFCAEDSKYSVSQVDVSYAVAWKNGKLRFRDERLEDIMRILERWYDVQFEYVDSGAKDMRFGFNIDRQTSIEPLLDMFEENGRIKVEQKGRKIIVKRVK